MGQDFSCCAERRPKQQQWAYKTQQSKGPYRSKTLLSPRNANKSGVTRGSSTTKRCSNYGSTPQLDVMSHKPGTLMIVPHNPEDIQNDKLVIQSTPSATQPSTQRQTSVIDEVDSEYNEDESVCADWNAVSVPNKNLRSLHTSQFTSLDQSNILVQQSPAGSLAQKHIDDLESEGQMFRLDSVQDDARSDHTTTKILAMCNSENASSDDLENQSMASVMSFKSSNFMMGVSNSSKKNQPKSNISMASVASMASISNKSRQYKGLSSQHSLKSGNTLVQRLNTNSGISGTDSISQGHVINLDSGSEADYPVNLSEFASEDEFGQTNENKRILDSLTNANVIEDDEDDDDDDVNFIVKENDLQAPSRRYSAYNQKANQIVSTGAFDVIHEEQDEASLAKNFMTQVSGDDYNSNNVTERTNIANSSKNDSANKIRESEVSQPIQNIDQISSEDDEEEEVNQNILE